MRVNSVLPGAILTEAIESMAERQGLSTEDMCKKLAKWHAMQRVGLADEVGRCARGCAVRALSQEDKISCQGALGAVQQRAGRTCSSVLPARWLKETKSENVISTCAFLSPGSQAICLQL